MRSGRRINDDRRAPDPLILGPAGRSGQHSEGRSRLNVTTDVPRRRPAPGDDAVERGGGGIGVDAPGGHDRERLPRVLVDDVEQLQDPPVRGLVELEVQRPDVVRPLSPQPHGGHRRVPQTLTLASLHRDAQPFLTPEPLHPLAIHAPSLLAQPAGYPRVRRGPVAHARRYPQRGWPREQACNSLRSASSPRPRAGWRRCVERCWPVTRHARRSDNSRRSCNMQTASRRRDGLTSFPGRSP